MNLTEDSKKLVSFYEKKKSVKKVDVGLDDFRYIFNLVKSSYNSINTKGKIPVSKRIKTKRGKQNNRTKKLEKVRLYLNNIDTCSFNKVKS